jgi:hypothetical protein
MPHSMHIFINQGYSPRKRTTRIKRNITPSAQRGKYLGPGEPPLPPLPPLPPSRGLPKRDWRPRDPWRDRKGPRKSITLVGTTPWDSFRTRPDVTILVSWDIQPPYSHTTWPVDPAKCLKTSGIGMTPTPGMPNDAE